MKKYLLPLFLLLAATVNLNSCKDDDDPAPSANISISLNGQAIDNNSSINLTKAAANELGSDTIVLSLLSDCDINTVKITVENNWEDHVDVIDINKKVYNGKVVESAGTLTKIIKFIGVIGKYNVNINTVNGNVSYSFSVNSGKVTDYNENINGALSNKQLVIFDATGVNYAQNILGGEYVYDDVNESQYFKGNLSKISEEDFERYSSATTRSAFTKKGSEVETWATQYNVKETPSFFIYNNGNNYYLMKIIEINKNILKAEIQY